MDPDAFWHQTPRLYTITLNARARTYDRERQDRAWLARTTAVLTRWGKGSFPTVEQLVGVQKKVAEQSPQQMKSVFAAMRAQAGAEP